MPFNLELLAALSRASNNVGEAGGSMALLGALCLFVMFAVGRADNITLPLGVWVFGLFASTVAVGANNWIPLTVSLGVGIAAMTAGAALRFLLERRRHANQL